MLVVVEQDVVLEGDVRVGGEQLADLHVAAVDGRDGDRSARVEGLEVLELQTVGAHQALQTERPLRAFGRAAQDQLAGDRLQIAQLGQLVLVGGGLGDDEAVRVDGLGVVEHGEILGRQHGLQSRLCRSRV